jgi:hypothetical protein
MIGVMVWECHVSFLRVERSMTSRDVDNAYSQWHSTTVMSKRNITVPSPLYACSFPKCHANDAHCLKFHNAYNCNKEPHALRALCLLCCLSQLEEVLR